MRVWPPPRDIAMIKMVTLLRARPGMSREAFREHYETHHRRIGEKVLAGHAVRYVRRYVEPVAPGAPLPDFDVVMEIWFPHADAYAAFVRTVSDPDVAEEIAQDEERLFDRPAIRSFVVDEQESTLPPPVAAV